MVSILFEADAAAVAVRLRCRRDGVALCASRPPGVDLRIMRAPFCLRLYSDEEAQAPERIVGSEKRPPPKM